MRPFGDFRESSRPSSAGKRGTPQLARDGFQTRLGGERTRRGLRQVFADPGTAEPLSQRTEPVISPTLRIPFLSMNRRMPLFIEFATQSPSPRRPVTT